MAGLTLKALKKTYDKDAHILKGIDLEIADGEFLVLVGPSGCGKSTLLRMIAGLEDITEGELFIGGRPVNRLPPKDRDVAMVFQSYALYPHMTVRENMGFSMKIRKRPKPEIAEAVGEAADMLGLDQLLDRLPKQLSGGQRQRVAIGRAIVRRPQIFLFDEPLSNLDANLRAAMRIELKKLHQKLGVTMVYVTHDQIEAMTLADRICVLEGGWARQVDTPRKLYEEPNSRFVAEFIGSPTMNILRLERSGRKLLGEEVDIPLKLDMADSKLPLTIDAGIRPHELLLDSKFPGRLTARVEVIETVGWDLHLHCLVGGTPLVAQVAAAEAGQVAVGDMLQFGVDPERIKLFDPENSQTLMVGV